MHWLARSGSLQLLTVSQSECRWQPHIVLVCDHNSLPILYPQFYPSSAFSMWQDTGLLCLPWYDRPYTSKLILYCWWQSCAGFRLILATDIHPIYVSFSQASWWFVNSLPCRSTELLVMCVALMNGNTNRFCGLSKLIMLSFRAFWAQFTIIYSNTHLQ